jgi:flagellar protein FlaG
MHSKVAPFAAAPDPTYGQHAPNAAHDLVVGQAKDGPAAEDPEQRLVIEEDQATGAVVYKRVDRRTGQVVAVFSRDVVLKMKDDADYVAGEVIRTRA